MQRCGITEREQPSLSVRSPQGAEIWIWPKALWVIGANGRVDIFSAKDVYVLVDVADEFQAPRWILHRVGKMDGRPFDRAYAVDPGRGVVVTRILRSHWPIEPMEVESFATDYFETARLECAFCIARRTAAATVNPSR